MAERVVREVSSEPAAEERVTRREVSDVRLTGPEVGARVILYITGILLVLLAFRFILALLGANPNNGFADFIYTVSHPFVAPFFGLFGYKTQYGVSRFELYTLIAMAVYAFVGWALARLATIGEPGETV